jgi:hypothetical protein
LPDSLREVQQRFFRLITAPESVEKALAAQGVPRADVERVIASDARKSAVERLDIYANMYFFRIRDVLAEMFPTVAAVLGEAAFHNLATDYLIEHPSSHPSLRNVGRALPRFLDAARRRSFGGTPSRPGWLADLARLEWARHDVFDAADAPALTLDALRETAPDAFAALPLKLIPALALVPVRYAAEEVWQSFTDESDYAPPPESPHELSVWRAGGDVFHRPLGPLESEALALIRSREETRFGHVCDWLTTRTDDEQQAAQSAFQLLAQWATDGILVAV